MYTKPPSSKSLGGKMRFSKFWPFTCKKIDGKNSFTIQIVDSKLIWEQYHVWSESPDSVSSVISKIWHVIIWKKELELVVFLPKIGAGWTYICPFVKYAQHERWLMQCRNAFLNVQGQLYRNSGLITKLLLQCCCYWTNWIELDSHNSCLFNKSLNPSSKVKHKMGVKGLWELLAPCGRRYEYVQLLIRFRTPRF